MMMKTYIRSAANISPQKTFDGGLFDNDVVAHTGNQLNCIEPDYKQLIDPKLIRRMSRVIKMGVASALACLKDAGIDKPDAIVTGTAYGCLDDTGAFLTKLVAQNEEMLTPTSFIQSTHNTIAAQIALLVQCHQYNNTFVNGGSSFESALLDAIMLLAEQEAAHVLVGGVDEITNISHTLLSRFGLYKRGEVTNLSLFQDSKKGTIGGEGAAFFLLSSAPSGNDLGTLDAIGTFYKPATLTETEKQVKSFLSAHEVSINDIDLLILGNNGDAGNDAVYTGLRQSVFKGRPSVNYKHLCGEYPTSSAFALWLAAQIISRNNIPTVLATNQTPAGPVKKVLIYNHYQNTYHSLMLISAC